MNILFIANNVTVSGRTGDSIHVREITEQLAKLGNRVFVIGRDLQGVSAEMYKEYQEPITKLNENDRIRIVQMHSAVKLSFPFNRDYQTIKKAIKIFKKNKIDLIYSRSFNAYLEGFLSSLFQVPLVLEINGLQFEEGAKLRGKSNNVIHGIQKIIARYSFNYPEKIIAITPKIRLQLNEEFNVDLSKITIVPNGVNENQFKPYTRKNAKLIKQYKVPTSAKIVLFVGAFDPWHGLENVPEAAKTVVESYPGVKFVMVGDGKMRPGIEKRVKKSGLSRHFIFTGSVPYKLVPLFINLSNICITPFPKENTHLKDSSPLKLFEYLACGRPVVATDVGGVAEIIKSSGGGLLVRPDDPDALSSGILELLKDEARQKEMGTRGRNYVLKNNTWKISARKVQEIFRTAKRSFINTKNQ